MEFVNRLQFVHCETLFATREEAKSYVEKVHNITRPALYAEPLVLKYGDESNPNIILAIGSVGKGTADMSNKTFFIDLAYVNDKLVEIEDLASANKEDIEFIKTILTNIKNSCGFTEEGKYIKSFNEILKNANSLSEADEILAQYVQVLEKRLTLMTKETNTVVFTLEKSENGMVLSSDVKLAENIIVENNLVQPNILIETENGLFTNVDLDYATVNNSLKLSINGNTKEIALPEHVNVEKGVYAPDTEELILTMNNGSEVRIAMGELIREWTVQESETPIVLTLEEVTSEDLAHGAKRWQDVLKADVRISNDEHAPFNILKKDEDGRSLRVDGLASNIKYQIGSENYLTVQEAIDNINIEYDTTTNKLTFTLGNKEVKSMPLNSVQLLDEIRYDANIESIIIIYKDIYNQTQNISIPVSDLINEWEIDNANRTVTLIKARNIQGMDILTADVNVTDKGVNNNILEVLNNKLYVNGSAENIKYGSTNVKESIASLESKTTENTVGIQENGEKIQVLQTQVAEVTVRTSENELAITNEVTRAQIAEGNLQKAVEVNMIAIANENTRAEKAEENLQKAVESNMTAIADEATRAKEVEQALIESDNAINQAIVNVEHTLQTTITEKFNEEKNRAEEKENRIIVSVGLTEDGFFNKTATNYGGEATTIAEEIHHIDAVLKMTADKNDENTTQLQAEINERKDADEEIKSMINNLTLTQLETPTNDTVSASYALIDSEGVQHGVTIDILKDKFLKDVKFENDKLIFEFIVEDGSVKALTIDIAEFIKESEFNTQAGIAVEGGVASVKLSDDTESVKYLSFSENGGIQVNGIDKAINEAITNEREVTKTREEKIENDLHTEIGVLSAQINAEASRAQIAEEGLSQTISTVNNRLLAEIQARIDGDDAIIASMKGLQIKTIEVPENDIVATSYGLFDADGNQYGQTIDILKDKYLKDVTLEDAVMSFTFILEDGSTKTEQINIAQVIQEAQYNETAGLAVDGGLVSVKLSSTDESKKYLNFDTNGAIQISGVESYVANMVSTETERASQAEAALQQKLDAIVIPEFETIQVISDDASVIIEQSESNTFGVKVNVSNEENNIIQTSDNGLVAKVEIEYKDGKLALKSAGKTISETEVSVPTTPTESTQLELTDLYYDSDKYQIKLAFEENSVKDELTLDVTELPFVFRDDWNGFIRNIPAQNVKLSDGTDVETALNNIQNLSFDCGEY